MFWVVFLSLCFEGKWFLLDCPRVSLGSTVTGVYYFCLGPFYGVSCLEMVRIIKTVFSVCSGECSYPSV